MASEQKKVYQKPVLERVVLVPQENVLAACHVATGSSQFSDPACQTYTCYGPSISITMP